MWWKRRIFHRAIPAEKDNHRVVELLRLAQAMGIEACPEIVVPPQQMLARPVAERYAVLHPNPKFRFRRWTEKGWRELAQALGNVTQVVVTGAPDQAERDYLVRSQALRKASKARDLNDPDIPAPLDFGGFFPRLIETTNWPWPNGMRASRAINGDGRGPVPAARWVIEVSGPT